MTTAPQYYKGRIAKDGAICGIRVWKGFPRDPVTRETLERAWLWRIEVNGVEDDITVLAPQIADGTGEATWQPITEADYEFYVADYQHCKKYLPNDPAANPRKAIDMNALPPLKW